MLRSFIVTCVRFWLKKVRFTIHNTKMQTRFGNVRDILKTYYLTGLFSLFILFTSPKSLFFFKLESSSSFATDALNRGEILFLNMRLPRARTSNGFETAVLQTVLFTQLSHVEAGQHARILSASRTKKLPTRNVYRRPVPIKYLFYKLFTAAFWRH